MNEDHELHFKGGRWDGLVLEIPRMPWSYVTIGNREQPDGTVADVEAGEYPRPIEPVDTIYLLNTINNEGGRMIATYYASRRHELGSTITFKT